MADHYFTSQPSAKHQLQEFTATLRGRSYRFTTDAGVFSKDEVDLGSQILIDSLLCKAGDIVLDLGCGYGPIGMAAANMVGPSGQVFMVDVNERAVELANKNLRDNGVQNAEALVSDGLEALPGKTFDWVLTNPPIRAGKAIIYPLLEEAYQALKPGGCLLVVIRTKQGAKSLEAHLQDVMGHCETIQKKAGFRVLKCCKQLHA